MDFGKSTFFVLLYFVQGIALAYFTGFQKRYLLNLGVSADSIALLTSLVLLPFVLKPLIGLIVDFFEIQRKAAIFFGLFMAASAFGFPAFVDTTFHLFTYSFLMILASLGIAIFDTVADALAVDTFQSSNFASLQSAMLAGKSLGLILFSIFFGLIIDQVGYRFVFQMTSLTMLLPLLLIGYIKNSTQKTHFQWEHFKLLKSSQFLSLALFGILYSIPSFGLSGLFAFFLSMNGHSALNVGWSEAFKSMGAILGAVSFPYLFSKFLPKKLLISITILSFLIGAFFAFLTHSALSFGFFIFLFGVIWAIRETYYTTLAMKITDPSIAATMFALLMAFSNFGTSIGEGLATSWAGRFGFPMSFLLLGILNFLSLICLKIKTFKTK